MITIRCRDRVQLLEMLAFLGQLWTGGYAVVYSRALAQLRG